MSIDPIDRLHDQQPVPGQDQNPSHAPDPDFITDNPDIQPGNGDEPERPGIGPDAGRIWREHRQGSAL
ncbi:hypothetical protein [Stutzerimonas nitrititolerans]|uniref:hypothetical protein n=1 Tax=Stutzerimonas nitrititolerans TaxID=2482751 RepID=UPI0028A9BC44|nr:hypothetical protein [Stutzerimonas nitrititolerans]